MMFFVIDNSQMVPAVLYASISAELTLSALNRSKKFNNRTVHSLNIADLKLPYGVMHSLKATRFEVVYKEPGKPDEVVYSDQKFLQCCHYAKNDANDNFSTTLDSTGDGATTFFLTAYNLDTHKYHWTVRPSEYAYCQESLNNA